MPDSRGSFSQPTFHSRFDLVAAARQTMLDNGFQPDMPAEAIDEAQQAPSWPENGRDLRSLLWSSIDNDSSRDLDQIECAERLPDGSIRVLIGIADVDAMA